ncbi:MAG TPA: hypothetical protein VLT45_27110, partial [Kofleriaceae bacterium]|nr:hypothetical protein [Kofleriaceae bacterium]
MTERVHLAPVRHDRCRECRRLRIGVGAHAAVASVRGFEADGERLVVLARRLPLVTHVRPSSFDGVHGIGAQLDACGIGGVRTGMIRCRATVDAVGVHPDGFRSVCGETEIVGGAHLAIELGAAAAVQRNRCEQRSDKPHG